MIDVAAWRARLGALAGRDTERRVFGAAGHGWRLAPPWTDAEADTFEARHGVRLPAAYRAWLVGVGAGGAGPAWGLWTPGTWAIGRQPVAWEGGDDVAPLSAPFPHTAAWQAPPDALAALAAGDDAGVAALFEPAHVAGSLPIGTLGDGIVVRLVITGPKRGEVWLDRRGHDGRVVPEDGLDFAGWIERWLAAAEATLERPPEAPPAPRARPDRVVSVLERASADVVDRVVAAAIGARAAGRAADFGPIGGFTAPRNGRVRFEQGPALRDAVAGGGSVAVSSDVAGADDVAALFDDVLELARDEVIVEVAGLFRAWLSGTPDRVVTDYLGRSIRVPGRRLLTVQAS